LFGAASGSKLRVFAVEHIESYVFVAGDGYLDGDGSDWDCRGWSCDGNDLGDDGGSSRSQAADVCTDGDRAATGLCDCGDADSEYDGGESERDLERDADGFERI